MYDAIGISICCIDRGIVYNTIGIQTKPRSFAPAKQYFRAEGSRAPCPASPHALGSGVTPPCQRASTF